ncbi:unnamed protein product [Calypogeia fissa]
MANVDGNFEVFPNDSSSSNESSDDDSSDDLIVDLLLIVAVAMKAYLVMHQYFEPIELSCDNQSMVIHDLLVNDLLMRHIGHPQQFKDLTNFTIEEFEELCRLVCPIIEGNARSTRSSHIESGRPCKLSPDQWLMSFVLYLKHDNMINFDASRWNWCMAAICDDALFVATCLNEAIAGEIRWPSVEDRRELGQHIPQLPGCIGVVDGTLVRIRRPYENLRHQRWFQGRKKMYCMNSSVVVDHNGLFIYIDPGYPGSYHDCTILQNSWVQANFRNLFVNTADYCEFVLGDSGYKGMEHYVMRGYSKTEIRAMHLPQGTVKTFNKMHVGYKVKVEWGIGVLKMKWRRLQTEDNASPTTSFKRETSTQLQILAIDVKEETLEDVTIRLKEPYVRGRDGHGEYPIICNGNLLMVMPRGPPISIATDIFRVMKVDLQSRQLLEVSLALLGDHKAGRMRPKPVNDGHYIFLGVGLDGRLMLAYNVHDDEWTCFLFLANDDGHGRFGMDCYQIDSPFRPG